MVVRLGLIERWTERHHLEHHGKKFVLRPVQYSTVTVDDRVGVLHLQ